MARSSARSCSRNDSRRLRGESPGRPERPRRTAGHQAHRLGSVVERTVMAPYRSEGKRGAKEAHLEPFQYPTDPIRDHVAYSANWPGAAPFAASHSRCLTSHVGRLTLL